MHFSTKQGFLKIQDPLGLLTLVFSMFGRGQVRALYDAANRICQRQILGFAKSKEELECRVFSVALLR